MISIKKRTVDIVRKRFGKVSPRRAVLIGLSLLFAISSSLAYIRIQPANAAPDTVSAQGSFAKRTTTGSQSITGLGFKPKSIIFYWTAQTSSPATSGATGNYMGMGFASGPSNERALSIWDENQTAAGATDSGRATYNNASIVFQGLNGVLTGGIADLTSFDTDGFTLNWSVVNTTAYLIQYYAFNENVVTNATVDTFSLTTGTGNLSVTNAGFQPDFVMMMTAGTTSHGVNTAEATYSMGVATSSTAQWSTAGRADDAVDLSDTCSYQQTNAIIAYVGTTAACSSAAEDATASFTQFTANGFDISKNNAPAAAMDVFYLALKGPLFKVGSFNKPTSAQSQSITGVGFQPGGVFLATRGQTTNAFQADQSDLMLGAAASATAQGSIGRASVDNNDASTPGMRVNASAVASTIEGDAETLTGEATLTSFDSDGFTLNWTTADGTADEYLYWAVGITPSTYTQSAYRWYSNNDGVQPGSALANENTAYTLPNTSTIARLRMQMSIADGITYANTKSFKLQYATSIGGTWNDITSGGWWNTSWLARKKITFNNSASGENLINFPVRVSLSSSNIDYSKTQNAGQDIRFIDSDGTVLKHEIEKWDESGTSEVWVKVPQINQNSNTDYIWMYYDNGSASDAQDAANVWDTNYKGVWHSQQDPSSVTAPQIIDSTGVNSGTTSNMVAGDSIVGQINQGLNFDGTNNTVDVGNNSSLNITTNTMTFSAWVKRATTSAIGYLFTRGTAGSSGYGFGIGNNDSSSCGTNTIQASKMGVVHACVGAVPADTNWHYLSVVWSSSGATAYIDGVASSPTNANNTAISTSTTNGKIGSSSTPNQFFNGGIDELRISSSARSADWIKASYSSEALTFNSFGSEEGQTTPEWQFYNNPTPANGAAITNPLLTGTDVLETYQESNPTVVNPNQINVGEQAEWDFALDPAGANTANTYYFRLVKSDDAELSAYSVYPQLSFSTSNTNPGTPTSLAQKKTNDTTLSTGDWTSENSIKLTASVSDADAGDTVKICAEVKPVGTALASPAGDGDGCSTTGVSSGGTATVTIGSLSDGTEYHWQIRAKDAAGAYSSWTGYGGNTENPPTNPAARDFGVDTSAPTGGTVYDGTSTGTDLTFNDASDANQLSSLSANWSGFNANASGLLRYDYSIGTTPGGTTVKNWTSNGTSTAVTATSLTLQTSQLYYVNVRAVDNAGNTSVVSSNGQYVKPTLSFSLGSSSIALGRLNAGNSLTATSPQNYTTSTNGYGGFKVYLRASDPLTSNDGLFYTVPFFNGGTYAAPAAWGSSTGFGFTTNDGDIFPQSGSCLGGGTAPCYAPLTTSSIGDVVSQNVGPVTGSSLSETQTITYRVTTSGIQQSKTYLTTLILTAIATY